MSDRTPPEVHIATDHNPDDVRTFYEVPETLADLIRPEGDPRTFTQALADLLNAEAPDG